MCSYNEELFNYEPWVVNFKNGYYDIKVNKFDQFSYDKNFFYEIPHNYIPSKEDYECLKFEEALIKWLGDDNPVILDDIFEIIGYCMTVDVSLKKAFYFFGPTDGGKTQFQTILEYIIGHKNRSAISLWRMNKNEFGTHGLQFKLINMVGDMASSGTIKNITQFLQVVGGDKYIGAEPKQKNPYNFRSTAKLIYNSNNLPIIEIPHEETKRAFTNRFIIVKFPDSIENGEIIRNFADTIILDNENEIKGIIYKAIEGLKRLYKRADFRLELMKNSHEQWLLNSEPIYKFMHENITREDDQAQIRTDEVLDRLNDF